jgi:hypothetical protein
MHPKEGADVEARLLDTLVSASEEIPVGVIETVREVSLASTLNSWLRGVQSDAA